MHADDYAKEALENPDIQIKKVWDDNVERGEQWAKELDVPFEENIDKVMKDDDIDAIIVTTSTNLHTEILLKACQHNKHIFTEKVLALSVKESEEIWKAKLKYNVQLMVSLPRLTEKEFLCAEEAVEKGWLGNLTMIRCRLAHDGAVIPDGEEFGWLPDRFYDKQRAGGGALVDLGAHPIYLTNRLMGKSISVYAHLQSISDQYEVDDSAVVTVEYESGALGIIETSFLSHGSPFQLQLYGTEGTLLAEDGKVKIKRKQYQDDKWLELEAPKQIASPMKQWADAIQKNSTPTITKDDFLQLTVINQAADLSHKQKKRVEIR
ncbi:MULTISPECIES: Gfo/Idh/MocA family oxidoreductase [Oceanobacillus]|uniref:Dehydrogenase n=1 Tax=Oceanobacillus kimchii TaxID=746691 RepID=A0ABQ5TPT3_9BACI|nr:Gfo/Idh/MocA family oxidoreductase [Oceanobacillus kimchii]GLO68207.1 dehydrogenase [Oceanobacillus kimchii]